MIRKVVLGALLVTGLFFGVRSLLRAFEPAETQIRRRVAEACQGFGEARMNPIMALFAGEYRDETTGFGREDLRSAVAAAFFQEKDAVSKGFPYRAEVAPSAIEIDVDPAGEKRARVRFNVLVRDTRGAGERVAWEFKVDANMEKRDDGWRIVGSTHETVSGSTRLRAR